MANSEDSENKIIKEYWKELKNKLDRKLGKIPWQKQTLNWLTLVTKAISGIVLVIGVSSALYAFKSTEDSDNTYYSRIANSLTLAGSLIGLLGTIISWCLGLVRSKKREIEKEYAYNKLCELEKELREMREQFEKK